jgi:hypothetical protein
LPEEERQKNKDLLFILEKFNVSESAKREVTVFCDGLPRTYLVSSMPERIFNALLTQTFDPSFVHWRLI